MDTSSHTTTDTLEQAEEQILDRALSDEALEAAAGMERKDFKTAKTYSHLGYCC